MNTIWYEGSAERTELIRIKRPALEINLLNNSKLVTLDRLRRSSTQFARVMNPGGKWGHLLRPSKSIYA